MMKIFKTILIVTCLLINTSAFAKEIKANDKKTIRAAISILRHYGYKENIAILKGKNYTQKPIGIVFKDLSTVNSSYKESYAVTVKNVKTGDLSIYISDDLKNSDVRAIACLLLHESVHCKSNNSNSVEEEMEAHTQEVMLYRRMLKDDSALENKKNDRLISKLNYFKGLYDIPIRIYVEKNPLYTDLLKIKEK